LPSFQSFEKTSETIQPLPIQEIPGLIRKEAHTGEDVMKIMAERYQDILF
jgi:hypothetical protein